MNWNIFREWLLRFHSHISRTEKRQVVFLLDNASYHEADETLYEFSNVEVIFLPPKTTGYLKPKDGGVVGSMKRK